jgi:hypothetical protein
MAGKAFSLKKILSPVQQNIKNVRQVQKVKSPMTFE